MTDAPRRRLIDRFAPNPTFIGAGSVFTGDVRADGDLVLAGRIVGDGTIRGSVTIATDGHWRGNVEAVQAVIAGIVDGSVFAADKLEIRKTARIRGTVRARHLAIAAGATVEGDITITSETAVTHFEEKRQAD